MMSLCRPPIPALRPFVDSVWYSPAANPVAGTARERVLPSGSMHIAVRLDDVPLQLFDGDADAPGRDCGVAVVGGARAGFYIKVSGAPHCTIGAQLRPGAARALFGDSAAAFVDRHTRLEDIWGQRAASLRERLQSASTPARQLDVFEDVLAARVSHARGMPPAIRQALRDFDKGIAVHDVVVASGCSHRRFVALFADAVGLTPKRYCRVIRFQAVLAAAQRQPDLSWSTLAHAGGFSDQSHFNREFRELAGVTPQAYRRISPAQRSHLPIGMPTRT